MLKNSWGGGGNTLSFLLAGVLALVASCAWAANVDWEGGSGGTEAEPLDLYNAANWSNSAPPNSKNRYYLTVDYPTVLTNSAPINTQIADWFSPYSGDFTFLGPMTVGVFCWDPSSANATIVKKGDWTVKFDFDIAHAANSYVAITNMSGNMTKTENSSDLKIGAGDNSTGIVENLSGDWMMPRHIYLGCGTGSRGEFTLYDGEVVISGDSYIGDSGNGTLTINGGTVDIGPTTEKWTLLGNKSGSSGTINLNGGQLKLWHLRKGSGTVSLVFNGGTLVANGASNSGLIGSSFPVTVNAGGGAIDNGGHSINVKAAISGEGWMKFCGVGTTTLSGSNTYTGETKIAVRTKLVVTSAELARLLANGGISVVKPEGVSAKGTYKLLRKSDGDCSAVEYESIRKGAGLEGATFAIDEDGDITVTVSHTPQIWAGAAETSATWSGANWDDGVVFDDGNDAVFATDGAIAKVDKNFSAYTLTFNDNTALTGTGTLTVPTITVAEGKSASIAGPLAGAIEKTGLGTLVLGSSRADTTKLSVGTLEINGNGTTLDWSKFKFGTGNTLRVAGGASITYDTYIIVGDSASNNTTLEISGMGSKVQSTAKYITIGDHANTSGTVTLTDGGKYENTGSGDDGGGLIVGTRGAGVLNVNGGEVTMTVPINLCYRSGSSAEVKIASGGKICANGFIYNRGGGGSTTAKIMMNGGTLKATADNAAFIQNAESITVTVGLNGGTIDAAGHAITIAKEISGDGGMLYKGGGKVTLTEQPTYIGVTTVEVGTMLVVPAAVAGDKLVFTVPEDLAAGVYTVVSISGDSQFADDVLSGKAEGFVLSTDNKKICYVKGMDTTKPIYIGTDGDLSAPGNWFDGTVPTGGTGDAQIFCTVASTLTVGDTFAPAKLIIANGSAVVTIGAGTLYADEVVNRQLLVVGEGATVVIGDQLILGNRESICDHINGTLVVSNLLLKAENGDRYVTWDQEVSIPGVFKFETITNSIKNNWFYFADKTRATTNVVYIGKGGLNFLGANDVGAYSLGGTGSGCSTIRPWYGDFAIEDSGTGKFALALLRDVTFCTDDENGIGCTITLNGKTFADKHSPKITVSGSGTLQVNNGNDNLVQPPVTVKDTATLAFGAGASLGTGAITLGSGTTLALTATSREFTPLANTLKLPTDGNANIRIDGKRLLSGDHMIASVATGSADNVAPDLSSESLSGRRASFRIEDGKLLLNIESNGTKIIVR